jgi:hypothetical protein
MRRLLSDQVTQERLALGDPDQLASAQVSSSGQKFGQKFGQRFCLERTLAHLRPNVHGRSIAASCAKKHPAR